MKSTLVFATRIASTECAFNINFIGLARRKKEGAELAQFGTSPPRFRDREQLLLDTFKSSEVRSKIAERTIAVTSPLSYSRISLA
jgi:hypothetical protein